MRARKRTAAPSCRWWCRRGWITPSRASGRLTSRSRARERCSSRRCRFRWKSDRPAGGGDRHRSGDPQRRAARQGAPPAPCVARRGDRRCAAAPGLYRALWRMPAGPGGPRGGEGHGRRRSRAAGGNQAGGGRHQRHRVERSQGKGRSGRPGAGAARDGLRRCRGSARPTRWSSAPLRARWRAARGRRATIAFASRRPRPWAARHLHRDRPFAAHQGSGHAAHPADRRLGGRAEVAPTPRGHRRRSQPGAAARGPARPLRQQGPGHAVLATDTGSVSAAVPDGAGFVATFVPPCSTRRSRRCRCSERPGARRWRCARASASGAERAHGFSATSRPRRPAPRRQGRAAHPGARASVRARPGPLLGRRPARRSDGGAVLDSRDDFLIGPAAGAVRVRLTDKT